MASLGTYAIMFGIVATPVVGFNAYYALGTHETERVTILDAFETVTGSGETAGKEKRIKVILENGCTETFRVEDSLFNGQWYSSNLHAVFAEGADARKTYDITHYGWRSGFFSMMENVVEAREVEGAEPFRLNANNPACRL